MKKSLALIPLERIERNILFIRGKKVMLDRDLAFLYEVKTKVLVQAVKRNRKRFPVDFMFQLSQTEFTNWRSQIVTSNPALKMSLRQRPYAFTEQGVAMLSSVLRSERAVHVNIAIMRTFVHIRELFANNSHLARKLESLEKKYDKQFKVVFDVIKELMTPPLPSKKEPIGFRKN